MKILYLHLAQSISMGIQYFSVLGLANTHGMKILWPLLAKSIYIGIQYFGVLSQAKSHGMKILWLCLAHSDSIFGVLGWANIHGMKILWLLLAHSISMAINYFGMLGWANPYDNKILWLSLAKLIFLSTIASKYSWPIHHSSKTHKSGGNPLTQQTPRIFKIRWPNIVGNHWLKGLSDRPRIGAVSVCA